MKLERQMWLQIRTAISKGTWISIWRPAGATVREQYEKHDEFKDYSWVIPSKGNDQLKGRVKTALTPKFLISWSPLASSDTLRLHTAPCGEVVFCSHWNTFGFAVHSHDASASIALWGLTYTDLVSKITLLLRKPFFCNIRKMVDGLHSLVFTMYQITQRELAF